MPSHLGFIQHDSHRWFGRLLRDSFLVIAATLLLVIPSSTNHAKPFSLPAPVTPQTGELWPDDTTRDDAALYDVSFVDPKNGWAVGEHGVIWHTDDGGEHWKLQHSGATCALRGVWFIDPQQGWAVGGKTQPYTWTSRATVLRTDDGGNSWKRVPVQLPALERVQFFDAKHGIAVGRGSGAQPSGIFSTSDGGQSWRALNGIQSNPWLAGDFIDKKNGTVVGTAGATAQVVAGEMQTTQSLEVAGRAIRDVALLPPTAGWLVGDGGLLMQTDDLGHRWQNVETLDHSLLENLDLHTLATSGSKIWAAGSPGSVILHSADAGRHWSLQPTGLTTPIHRIKFLDGQHGWCVGSMGTILATTDGGQNWQVQRQGGQRVAVLGLFAESEGLPLETLARISRKDGYRLAVHIASMRDADASRPDRTEPFRLREALSSSGANGLSVSWRFRQASSRLGQTPEQAFAEVDRMTDGKASAQMLAELVTKIRLWRPEVVIVPSSTGSAAVGLNPMVSDLAQTAIRQAADPTAYVELSTALHLPAWQVKRVYASLPGGERGTHRIDTDDILLVEGKTLAEVAGGARGLLHSNHVGPQPTNEFTLLANYAGNTVAGSSDLLAGLQVSPASGARRARVANLSADDPRTLRRLANKRRNLARLLHTAEGNPAWLAQIVELTHDLPPDAAAQLLYELAHQYRQAGQMQMASDTLQLLVRRHAEHPLADSALVWLVQFYASGETAYAYRSSGDSVRTALAEDIPQNPRVQQAVGENEKSLQQLASFADNLSSEQRLTRAVQLVEHIGLTRPTLHTEPTLRFPWTVAQRKRGFAKSADRYLFTLRRQPEGSAWQACAQAEAWLHKPKENLPAKSIANCRSAKSKPKLDGTLDEPFWQSALPLSLGKKNRRRTQPTDVEPDPNQLPPCDILLAYDKEFLYLAIRCQKAEGVDYSADPRPRPYDGDLTGHDRVRLQLDVDRDYATYFQFSVDHRGWTRDACWHDATWNPQWFVAAGGDETTWTVEAAIPWRELTDQVPTARHVWAVALDRVVPTRGVQCWSGPTLDQPRPENFGLLVFD